MSLKQRAERLGHLFFYLMLHIGGQRLAYFALHPIIFIYILFSPTPHRNLAPYIDRRFPNTSWLGRRIHVYKIIIGMGKMLIDRALLGLKKNHSFKGTFEGFSDLQTILNDSGAVIVLAHVGTWQTAMSHMAGLDTPVHAIMVHDDNAVTKHFYEMGRSRPFHTIDAAGFMGGMIEAADILEQGELVLIMGDRAEEGQTTAVPFLGKKVNFPVAAYNLAAITSSPIVIAFSAKTGTNSHVLKIWDIVHPKFNDYDKQPELNRCALRFSQALEQYVEEHPHQWYNFFNIWHQ
jgi:predicted LPLAT superfamily acyltransferase